MTWPGDEKLDRYEAVEVLGRGGSATVYRAMDRTLQRPVAIKVIFDAEEAEVADAREEARLLAAVRHPNVVAVHDVIDRGGVGYIVMELVEGDDLQARLQDHGPLETGAVVRIVRQVADALDAAHAQGVIHRDIKPANIVLDDDGGARVTDFGIGRFRDTDEIVGSHIRGSVAYVAPERLSGHPGDHAVDIYALAAVAFELLTGRAPFVDDEPLKVAKAHLNDAPPRPSTLRVGLPGPVDEAILRGLAKEPQHRWSSAGAFADALEAAFRPAVAPERSRTRLFDIAAAAAAAAVAAIIMVAAAPGGGDGVLEGELISEPQSVSTAVPAEISTLPPSEDGSVTETDAGGQGRCPEHARCGKK